MGGQGAVEDVVTLVEAGRNRPVPLQFADAAFHCVAIAVLVAVEGRGASAGPAAPEAVGFLIVRFGDRCLDVALSQVGAVGAAGVGLVAAGPGPGGCAGVPSRFGHLVQALYESWGYRKVGERQPFPDSPVYAVMLADLPLHA